MLKAKFSNNAARCCSKYMPMHIYPLFILLLLPLYCFAETSAAREEKVPPQIDALARFDSIAWSWFQDERLVIDERDDGTAMILLGGVQHSPNSKFGRVVVLWANAKTKEQGVSVLSEDLRANDHSAPALFIRPSDGRYLAMYTDHVRDHYVRYRLSALPSDPTKWLPEKRVRLEARATYSNIYHIPQEGGPLGRTYNFVRAVNYDPNFLVSEDQGETWKDGPFKLLNRGARHNRSYVKYATDGRRIHIIVSEEHPFEFDTSLFHGYIENGKLYTGTGDLLDENLFDDAANDPTRLTEVFKAGSELDGVAMHRAWPIDFELDRQGNPCAVFSVRANDDVDDHRFVYAWFDGSSWQLRQLAQAGGPLFPREVDYTGLAAIDPANVRDVIISSPFAPGTSKMSSHYRLFVTSVPDDRGALEWSELASESSESKMRPIIARSRSGLGVFAWLQGEYRSYVDWSTAAVMFPAESLKTQSLNAGRENF